MEEEIEYLDDDEVGFNDESDLEDFGGTFGDSDDSDAD